MIKNTRTRRRISLGLLASGGVLFLLAPENAWMGLGLIGFGVLLEIIGVKLGHSDPSEQ
jgi:hypothetical protein